MYVLLVVFSIGSKFRYDSTNSRGFQIADWYRMVKVIKYLCEVSENSQGVKFAFECLNHSPSFLIQNAISVLLLFFLFLSSGHNFSRTQKEVLVSRPTSLPLSMKRCSFSNTAFRCDLCTNMTPLFLCKQCAFFAFFFFWVSRVVLTLELLFGRVF